MSDGIVVIRKGREKPVVQQHPWIFSGAIDSVRGDPTPGDIVTVTDHKGAFLARGYWNPKSQIQVRILTWQDEPINEDWWRRMLKRAIDARYPGERQHKEFAYPNAQRLINAENDFIPGLIVDRYDNWLVLQALTLHIDQQKLSIAQLLAEIVEPKGIYERSDVDVRNKEGLKQTSGLLWGEEPPQKITFVENGRSMLVDVRHGHKTGFYLDQRDNRDFLLHEMAINSGVYRNPPKTELPRMLNLFSYTGGFGIQLVFQAQITNVDASLEVLEMAEENFKLNSAIPNQVDFIQADVFDYLHDQVAEGAQYDVIVCDPPKFAHNAGQVERAARGYKDLNLNCFKLVKPGGYLMTFSCSGAIDADLFQKIVFGALVDSGRQAQIVKHLTQAEDHPVALTFPEGAYLKGLLLRVY
ncbi:MAG: class I SAM-dependent rRNA methyltransferase [Chloroflexi bacterium]|nr:class I SAM-dependent rRNA methyltransferase [Chloroflexota bacterium]